MKAKTAWTDVLEAVRGIAPEEGWAFTVDQVAAALSIDGKEAAKWVTKLVDWDYVRRGEFEPEHSRTPGRRPRRLYHILKRGLEKELGGVSDVDRLLGAIQAVRDARGEAQEKQAIVALFKAHDFVVNARDQRFQRRG